MKKMQKLCLRSAVLLLCFVVLFGMVACEKEEKLPELWEGATYTQDALFGTGEKTVTLTVEAGEKSVKLILMTDKEVLGDVLMQYGLIEGEDSTFGLMIHVVNGIRADYDADGAYWAFYKEGEYAMVGVDSTEIADGEHYELVYTKG